MAKPATLPQQALDNAAGQAQSHLPTELPPVSTGPAAASSTDVSLPQHALDAVDHIAPLGVNHLPDFFF
jgi:hypothetical protein